MSPWNVPAGKVRIIRGVRWWRCGSSWHPSIVLTPDLDFEIAAFLFCWFDHGRAIRSQDGDQRPPSKGRWGWRGRKRDLAILSLRAVPCARITCSTICLQSAQTLSCGPRTAASLPRTTGNEVGPAEDGLSSGEIGGGSALLREDGDEGADPAVAMNERGAGERREVNWVLISLTKEGMEVEEEVGGEGEVGERANTGTEEKWSTGILIFSQHREQTSCEHI